MRTTSQPLRGLVAMLAAPSTHSTRLVVVFKVAGADRLRALVLLLGRLLHAQAAWPAGRRASGVRC